MSDEEFLARWSHRKREGERPLMLHSRHRRPRRRIRHRPSRLDMPLTRPVDLSSLPPIESIDAATDITAFLRKEFRRKLRHAALRRAWSADPAIRGFVGLAENAWDFNDPNAMPGFGPLDCSGSRESARSVDRIIGGVRQAAEVSQYAR